MEIRSWKIGHDSSTEHTGMLAPKEAVISSTWEPEEGLRDKKMTKPRCSLVCFVFFGGGSLLMWPRHSGTHNPSASASRVLGFQTCIDQMNVILRLNELSYDYQTVLREFSFLISPDWLQPSLSYSETSRNDQVRRLCFHITI